MQADRQTVAIAVAIAIGATLCAMTLGENLGLALGIGLVWCGTLWLVAAAPGHIPPPSREGEMGHNAKAELIEHLAAPTLLTSKGRIIIASRSAREALGSHIISQDIRMVLRQPEAVTMLASEDNGEVMIHGLVRRRDSWRVTRTAIAPDAALIELSDETAEADISHAHSEFVANASHELRTPLASIIGYGETLEEAAAADELEPKMARQFLGTILREAGRMQSLISDLMSLSRIEAERHGTPTERLDLAPLVASAARDAAGPERRERLELLLDDQAIIAGDAQQIEQLVRNLVDNSMKYADDDSPVTVTLSTSPADQAVLTVADKGTGIAPQHLPHLTRRFYRTDPGRSRASGGTGLGLAIVKHIVERHRGRLDISSMPGEGTTVRVRLPLALTE